MDTKKIYALLTVIRCGSLSSAAEELGYTQPGLTNMMNSLEDELGLTLLSRGKSGVRLSDDGQALYEKMRALSAATDDFFASAAMLREKGLNKLKIGAINSAARNWIPAMVASYREKNLGSEILVRQYDVLSESYEAVRNGEIDCAIVSYLDEPLQGLDCVPLYEDEIVAILPESFPGHAPVKTEIFEGKDFLMPSGGLDLDIMPIFRSCEKMPVFKYSNLDDPTIVSMVAHGLGTSILTRLIMQGINERVRILSIDGNHVRNIGIIYKSGRRSDRSIREFIQTAKDTIKSF